MVWYGMVWYGIVMYVCMYVCMYVFLCMYVCMYVLMYVCMYFFPKVVLGGCSLACLGQVPQLGMRSVDGLLVVVSVGFLV